VVSSLADACVRADQHSGVEMQCCRISFDVPYVCQFASPELVHDLVYGLRPLESDPSWALYGASTPQEYAHWALRACGVVCVKMTVEALTGTAPRPVMTWVREGLSINGYLTELRPDRPDRPIEKGWRHAALAELAARHGLDASLAQAMTPGDLLEHIQADRLVIASVSSELGEAEVPITRKSGHLVVILGVTLAETGQIDTVVLHNPSGRTPGLQAEANIPAARFEQGFSGRGIVIGRRQNTGTTHRPPG